MGREFIDKSFILASIKNKASIAAFDESGNILAVRLGTIYTIQVRTIIYFLSSI